MSGHEWHTGGRGEDGFGLPPDDPVPSSSSQIYCVDCGCYVSNYIQCLEYGHMLPAYSTLCDTTTIPGPLDFTTQLELSGVSTGYTEGLFSTLPTTDGDTSFNELFETGPSTTGSQEMHAASISPAYGRQQYGLDNEFGIPVGPVPNQFNSGPIQPLVPFERAAQHRTAYAYPEQMHVDPPTDAGDWPEPANVPMAHVSQAHGDTFEIYRQRWASQGHVPTSAELMSIATLEGLRFDVVKLWFEVHLNPLSMPLTVSTGSTGMVKTLSEQGKGKQRRVSIRSKANTSKTVDDVRLFAKAKFRENCEKHQSRRAAPDLLYQCTGSAQCHYSTNERDAWQRHEQIWQPQEFWHCVVCRAESRKPSICSRKDKLLDHLSSAHGIVDRARAEGIRNDSKVAIEAGFETRCKFIDRLGLQCPQTFDSWEARIRHYLDHFNDRVADGPWQLCLRRDRWFDDEEDDTQGSTGFSGSSSGQWAEHSGQSTSNVTSSSGKNQDRNGVHSRSSHQHAANELSRAANAGSAPKSTPSTPSNAIKAVVCSTSHATKPSRLIDVKRLYLVVPPANAKYLALDHTWTNQKACDKSSRRKATPLRGHDSALQLEHCPVPWEEVIAFTKDLGYRFLWIAQLCEPQRCDLALRTILQRASLTMVPVKMAELKAQTVFFACRSNAVQKVHALALGDLAISHIRNLGHGAFGIVDEVRLRSSNQSFARKELCATDIRSKLGAFELKEIEIMQKLQHPHIAQIGGAYYEPGRQTWNILMTPVADCTLREYMANPSRWPGKGNNVARWFLCLTAALKYLHGQSCRHKDIKPANILISGGDVLLTDFGTSYDFSRDDDSVVENSATHGRTLSTPRYCAPEVAAEESRGRKADVFSLGCVFVEMLTFALGSDLKKMQVFVFGPRKGWHATYHHNLARLKRWLGRLKRATTISWYQQLAGICMRMTALDADDRPSAAEVLDELLNFIGTAGQGSNGLCACLQHRVMHSPTSHAWLADEVMHAKRGHISSVPTDIPVVGLDLGFLSMGTTSVSLQSIFCKSDAGFFAFGVTRLRSADAMSSDMWGVYAVSCTAYYAQGAVNYKSKYVFSQERLVVFVESSRDVMKPGLAIERPAALKYGPASPRRTTPVVHSNRHRKGGLQQNGSPYVGLGGSSCSPLVLVSTRQSSEQWRRRYRKVLRALRWTLSRRESPPTAAVAVGNSDPTLRLNMEYWALSASIWSSLLDADLFGFLLWLTAYEVSVDLKQNMCLTAVILAFTRIDYIDFAQGTDQAQTCSCGSTCSEAATAVAGAVTDGQCNTTLGHVDEELQCTERIGSNHAVIDELAFDSSSNATLSASVDGDSPETDASVPASSTEASKKDENVVEVGDLGQISLDVLVEAFQKYRRCTCHTRVTAAEEITNETAVSLTPAVGESNASSSERSSETGCADEFFREDRGIDRPSANVTEEKETSNAYEFGFYDMW